jgi:hypothetical protein
MTFFYDLNKRMAELANKQTLAEGKNAKPDFLDIDKDGDKKEPMKKAVADKDGVEESALQAYLGKKKYGEQGMKALQQAGRDGASKQKMASIRAKHDKMDEADMDEGNEFSGALARAKASGASEFEVDGKKYQVTSEGFKEMDAYLEKKKKEQGTGKFDKKQISTGTVYTRRHEEEDEDDEDAPASKGGAPKKKGRKEVGAGKGKKIGAKSRGTSKLASKGSIAEDDSIPLVDKGEYDREGDMAKEQLYTIELAAKELASILSDDQNLPEWVQSKITKAMDYVDTARDYMISTQADQADELVAEKAVSKQQQKFMGMAHAMQKGERIKGASPELKKVAKTMKKSDVEDFAATKHEGLPKKVKADKEVEETAEAPKKAKGGIEFGKGVYESINSRVENMISEGMNVSVNMSTNEHGELTKNITVSAEGDEAESLAQLLNLAGMKSSSCGCGQSPCGCSQMEESYGDTDPTENAPDYPTEQETIGSDDEFLRRFAGGLNKPKSTGQTTVPVVASQQDRLHTMEETKAEKLGMNLYAELKQFKAK